MKSNLKRAAAAAILMLCFSKSAPAGEFEDAAAAHNKGDFATALRLFYPLAESGSAAAQTNLGIIYRNGQSVPQDYAKARKWFRLAADQGMAVAQYSLGNMYA